MRNLEICDGKRCNRLWGNHYAPKHMLGYWCADADEVNKPMCPSKFKRKKLPDDCKYLVEQLVDRRWWHW